MLQDLYQAYLHATSISTDTRTILPGAMYFALRGERFDGNTHALDALQLGANCIVIDNEKYENEKSILVPDVLQALHQLASHHRTTLNTPIVALTGSNGKTTTKELMQTVLSQKYNVLATSGNLNNHIGVPLTLLGLRAEHQIGIVEIGANHQGEVASLCAIALPDVVVITNMGKAHLEGFGGIEGVRKGKGEMYDYAKANNKTILVNKDDDVLLHELHQRNITGFITYGESATSDYIMHYEADKQATTIHYKNQTMHTQLFGAYNCQNAAIAIALGEYYEVPIVDIKKAIEAYRPINNRSQTETIANQTWILDAYNANPSSMQVALESFLENHNAPTNYILLGDMFELGNESEQEHKKIVQLLVNRFKGKAILIGPDFCHAAQGTTITTFATTEACADWFCQLQLGKTTLLLKGSRGMRLETILQKINPKLY